MTLALTGTVADRDGEHLFTLSEVAPGVGTKTLLWPADVEALIAGIIGRPPFELLGVRCELTATATAGVRRPVVRLLDASNDTIFEAASVSTLTATQAGAFEFGAGWGPATAAAEAAGAIVRAPLPVGLFVLPGHKLVVTQETVIDAADSIVVHIRGRVRLDH